MTFGYNVCLPEEIERLNRILSTETARAERAESRVHDRAALCIFGISAPGASPLRRSVPGGHDYNSYKASSSNTTRHEDNSTNYEQAVCTNTLLN